MSRPRLSAVYDGLAGEAAVGKGHAIDGSMYIANEHRWADLTRLVFTERQGSVLSAHVDITFDWDQIAFTPASLPKTLAVTWPIELVMDEAAFAIQWEQARALQSGRT